MKGNFKATSALALLSTTNVTSTQVKKFGEAVAEEFRQIPLQERMNAARAILVGIGFHAVKQSLKHGEFGPWLQANVNQVKIWSPSTAKVNASYYMRLAIAFVEQAQPTQQELLALTAAGAITPNLKTADSPVKKLIGRIEDFVGERSLNEILIDEGIKGGGSSGGGGSALPAGGAGEDPLLADTATYIMGLRQIFCTPDNFKRLPAAQRKDAIQQLASILEEARKLDAAARS